MLREKGYNERRHTFTAHVTTQYIYTRIYCTYIRNVHTSVTYTYIHTRDMETVVENKRE